MHAEEKALAHKKAPKTTLEIRIGNRFLTHRVAARVFCTALQEMGFDRVAKVGLRVCGHPLISKCAPVGVDGKVRSYQEVDSWVIVTNTSTREKKALLEQVAESLKIPINVKITTVDAQIDALLRGAPQE